MVAVSEPCDDTCWFSVSAGAPDGLGKVFECLWHGVEKDLAHVWLVYADAEGRSGCDHDPHCSVVELALDCAAEVWRHLSVVQAG